MNPRFINICQSSNYKRFKEIESKLYNIKHNIGCIMSVLVYVLLIMGVALYNDANNFQTFILYSVIGAFICIIPTILICVICENLYKKAYDMIISDTKINTEYNKLYALYNPYETRLKSLINEYINNKYLEIISEIKYDSSNYQLKNDFKENHGLLQVVLSSPLYIYTLSDFLIESEKIIKSFQSTDNDKKTNSKSTNSDYIGGADNTIIADKTSVQFFPQILPSSEIRETVRKLTIEDLMPEADDNKVESPKIYTKRASNTTDNSKAIPIRKANKVDWIAVNKAKNDVGLCGEILVLTYEINKLLALNMEEYASKVEHVSVTQGDGLGYDILSFDEKGGKIYIEVKTTTKSSFGEVFFTRNELECMRDLKNYYYLYRVFDLNIESQTGSIKIFKGNESINSCFNFYTQSVKAKIRTDINISEMNVKDVDI